MLPGYNTNVTHQGDSYHIQTEDGGVNSPLIISIVYRGGAILAQKRLDYSDLLAAGNYQKELAMMIKSQHREMIKQLLRGDFQRDAAPTDAAAGAAETLEGAPPLDDQSLDAAIVRCLQSLED
jgi:hypothetical protein